MTVFIDTGYFIALLMPRDQWHERAIKAARPGMRFVTSALVINETISLLQASGFFSAALEFLRETRANPDLRIVYPEAAQQLEAWDLFSRWGTGGANAVDCVSFAIMKELSIKSALTFDEHFRAAGFSTLR